MIALLRPFLPYILIGLLGTVGVGGAYFYIRQQGVAAEREAQFLREIEAYKREVVKSQKVSRDLEVALASSRQQIRKINERLARELGKDPVYRECVTPDSGMQLYNATRAGTADTAS